MFLAGYIHPENLEIVLSCMRTRQLCAIFPPKSLTQGSTEMGRSINLCESAGYDAHDFAFLSIIRDNDIPDLHKGKVRSCNKLPGIVVVGLVEEVATS